MEVFVIGLWLCAAAAQTNQSSRITDNSLLNKPDFSPDYPHLEDMMHKKRFAFKKKYRPLYHISAPVGWLSDPNAFISFKRQYHIFYQYHPYNGAWGPIHWGHIISNNLIDWAFYPPALVPKESYDKHGCLAGSAVVHNTYLTLFYTGTMTSKNKTRQTQNIAISADGVTFQKYLYNPVIRDVPHGVADFRNPKVWRFMNTWYMIVGTSNKDQIAELLLYTSVDLFNWKLTGTVAHSFGDMGYMWESPDLFELDGYHVLILSVQGIQTDAFRFRNLHQTGYFVGNFDHLHGKFENLEVSTTTFSELDYGHDFYAAKTMQDSDGRRLLIAWLGMWDSEFQESTDGWASMLTLVRELRLTFEGRLLMNPVKETLKLRSEVLEEAWYSPGEAFYAGSRAFELVINSSGVLNDAVLMLEWNDEVQYSISYLPEHGFISVERNGIDGVRRADWLPNSHIYWRIFVDYSSIELFCGEGEVVFSSRIYPKGPIQIRIGGEMQLHVVQYKMRRSVGFDIKLRKQLRSHFGSRHT